MSASILLLDIGNTNVKYGLAGPGGISRVFALPTDHAATADAIGLAVSQMCALESVHPRGIAAWVASSVVPQLEPAMRAAARDYCECPALFAPRELPLPLVNRYERPQEVGADRLVTAYAATRLHAAPAHIVIDFGTATTYECVVGNDYLGGLICPGVLSSAHALASRTAKLPQVTLEVEGSELSIGKSTSQSLNQGLVFGFAAMTEGLVARLKARMPEGALVVGTGGFARRIADVTAAIDVVAPDLLLEGLRLAWLEREGGAA